MSYSTLKLTVTSPVQIFTEPVSVAETKAYLEVPDADTTRDDDIEAMISAAREVAEHEQGCDLVAKQWDLQIDYFPARAIQLRRHVSSIDILQYTDDDGADFALVENTDFILDTAKCIALPAPGGSWPSFTTWPSSAVLVRYTVTPPAVDSRIKRGIIMLVTAWFHNRIQFELGASEVQEYPFAITHLLRSGREERV